MHKHMEQIFLNKTIVNIEAKRKIQNQVWTHL